MRRVVTGVNSMGKALFTHDDETPHVFKAGNFEMGEAWFDPASTISDGIADHAEGKIGSVPLVGETLLRYVVFPPRAEMEAMMQGGEESDFDESVSSDFNNEEDDPGMHTTETIDYGFVLEGSITLQLDDNQRKTLHQGDCFVQNGTRHAWLNETDKRAVLGVVMHGASRD